jgi:alpha-mannosidase
MKSFKNKFHHCVITIIIVMVSTLVYSQSNTITGNKSALIPNAQATYDKTYTNYLVPEDHIDLCWYFDWQRCVTDIMRTVNNQLEICKNNPDYKFMLTQSQVYRWLQEYRPDLFQQVKKLIAANRWEIAGGQWCEPDNTLPSGEMAARNFLIGKLYARKELDTDIKIGYLPDSFGHIWTYPQILKLSGIDFFIETKLDANKAFRVPYLCNWRSPDGTDFFTCNSFYYGIGGGVPTTSNYMNVTIDRGAAYGFKKALRTFGPGDNGGGPKQAWIDSIHVLNTRANCPTLKISTFKDFYDAIINDPNLSKIPTWNDELYVDSRRGVWTCGAAEKYYRRKTDVKVEEAEKFASLAMSLGAAQYPVDKLKQTWEYLCLLTNHDHSNGTWCNNTAYNRTLRTFGIATNFLDTTLNHACDAIASRAATEVGKGNVPVIVFNPLSWERNDVVETQVVFDSKVRSVKVFDNANKEVPSQVKSLDGKTATIVFEANHIPGTGFKVFKVTPGIPSSKFETGLKIGDNEIENGVIKATLSGTTGNFTSVRLKGSSWEAIKPGAEANELQLLVDKSNSRDVNQKEMEATPMLINNLSNLKIVESGPVRVVYRFNKSTPSGKTQGSAITQDIVMYSNLGRIDIKTNINWDEQFKMLKVSFPLNVTPDSCTYEIPFGNISRSVTRNTPETAAKFEVYGHKWADMSKDGYGVSILNDSKYGWDALNNRLRLSLFKSSNDKDTRFEKGTYTTTYSIYPHAGDWKKAQTVKQANEMNYPVIAKQVAPHNGSLGNEYSFVSVDRPNVMITAIKKAEDHPTDLIVRLVEINGVPSTNCKVAFQGAINSAATVNLIEDNLGTASFSGKVLSTTMHQYEIKSFRVSFENPAYQNSKPALTKVDLSASYNLDGISSNGLRTDGDLDGKGNSFATELMPRTVESEEITFTVGDATNGSKNIVNCMGQTIKLPAGNYTSLQVLAVAAGGEASEKGTFKVGYKSGKGTSKTLSIRDWIAEFYTLQGDLKGWDAPIKENIASVLTHRHTSKGDDTCRTTYLFKYDIPLSPSKKATTLILPKNDKIKVLAVTLVNAPMNSVSQASGMDKNGAVSYLKYVAQKPNIGESILGNFLCTPLQTQVITGNGDTLVPPMFVN